MMSRQSMDTNQMLQGGNGEKESHKICTSNYMVCRAITGRLNSLVIARAFRRGLLQNYSNFQRAINP